MLYQSAICCLIKISESDGFLKHVIWLKNYNYVYIDRVKMNLKQGSISLNSIIFFKINMKPLEFLKIDNYFISLNFYLLKEK